MLPCEKCEVMIPLPVIDYLVTHLILHHGLSREDALAKAISMKNACAIKDPVEKSS